MSRFKIASFNVKNLIGADQEYYEFERYSPEEHAWKQAWLAEQLLNMNADIIGFQEIFDEAALRAVIAETDRRGIAANAAVIPPADSRYARKAIFSKLAFAPYADAALAFAPNINDGAPGHRRPGVAILSRFGFTEPPRVLQALVAPLTIKLGDAGSFTISALSRPLIMARVPVGDQVISVFNCHLKSKLGEYIKPEGADFAPEVNLLAYDPGGRALGSLRAGLRRMAEAWVLRREIIAELDRDRPVIVTGDFNDSEAAVSTDMVLGEAPFKNYNWIRRHDAQTANDRYTPAENAAIQDSIDRVRLYSAENLFIRKSLRDMVFTTAFNGQFESIDQILLSRHFHPDHPGKIGEMEYFSVLNDHITDGSHPDAPYNKLASDHGQIIAHMRLGLADLA